MNLRSDPIANALMAGAFTKANAEQARRARSAARRPRASSTSRISLGPTGASRLIELATDSARTRAPPRCFRARRVPIRGSSTTSADRCAARPRSTRRWSAATTCARRSGESRRRRTGCRRREQSRSAASVRAGYRQPHRKPMPRRPKSPAARAVDTGPVFHGLFRTSAGREAVAPVVSALWTSAERAAAGLASDARVAAAAPGSDGCAGGRTGTPVRRRRIRAVATVPGHPACARACSAAGSERVKNSSIFPKIYGEHFLKAPTVSLILPRRFPAGRSIRCRR